MLVDAQNRAVGRGDRRTGSRTAIDERQLAEDPAGVDRVDDPPADRDLHLTLQDDVHVHPDLAIEKDRLIFLMGSTAAPG